jgi:hypothetical protein
MHFDHLIDSITTVSIVLADVLVALSEAMLDNTEAAALWAAEGLRSSSFKVSRNFKVLGCPSHKVDDIAAQDHLLLSKAVTEELVQSDRWPIPKDSYLYNLDAC